MSINSLVFDGTGLVTCALTSPVAANALTVAFWMKSLSAGRGDVVTCWEGGVGATDQFDALFLSGGAQDFFIIGTANRSTGTGAGNVADGSWHHYCGTWDGTTVKVYLDGVLQASAAGAATLDATPSTLVRFGNNQVGDGAYTGKLTIPAIWDVALGGTDITALAAGTLPNALGTAPLAYWPFTEGAGGTVADGIGGNTGTLSGGATWSSDVPLGLGGLAWDFTSTRGSNASSASYTWSHTCTGIDRFLVVDVYIIDTSTPTVTGVTYNSVAMSFLRASSVSFLTTTLRVESWGLAAPATGTNTVAVTLSGAPANTTGFGVSYAGVDQSYPTEGAASANGVGTAASVSVTSVADNDWGHAAILTNDASPTEGEQPRATATDTWGFAGAEDTDAPVSPPATTALTYTNASALSSWAMLGFAIRPLGAPAPTSAPASRSFFVFQAVNAAATY